MILHTSLQWLSKAEFDPQKSPHILPTRARYGVSLVRIWENIYHFITAPHCTFFFGNSAIEWFLSTVQSDYNIVNANTILYSAATATVENRSCFEILKKKIPWFTVKGRLGFFYFEYFGGNWQCYSKTALHFITEPCFNIKTLFHA